MATAVTLHHRVNVVVGSRSKVNGVGNPPVVSTKSLTEVVETVVASPSTQSQGTEITQSVSGKLVIQNVGSKGRYLHKRFMVETGSFGMYLRGRSLLSGATVGNYVSAKGYQSTDNTRARILYYTDISSVTGTKSEITQSTSTKLVVVNNPGSSGLYTRQKFIQSSIQISMTSQPQIFIVM